MKKNKDAIVVSKSKLKKLTFGVGVVGALVGVSISAGVSVAKTSYQKYKGAEAITSEVIETGLLPKGLSVRDDSEVGLILVYNQQRIYDVEAFFNDRATEASDYGLSVDQFAVAAEFAYGYEGEIIGATKKGMEQAKLDAYHIEQIEQNKGVSK